MKKAMKYIPVIAGVMLVTLAFKPGADVPEELAIGSSIPKADVKMKDAVSGNDISLKDAMKENGLVVIFSCNTCPYVGMYEDRMKEGYLQASAFKVGYILVNSNEALRDNEDSFDAMKTHASDKGYKMPYVLDVNSDLANAFGATKTPHVFVFDKNGKLVYRGAIDDNPKDAGASKERYLRDAIGFVSQGKTMPNNSTKSIGCSIKRKQ
ncbi:MAG TPA: thioredoxin family protein [Bacteroidia bacterium]|jgi:thioredoxin-related protein